MSDMNEDKKSKISFMEEFKIFLLILTAIFGFLYVPEEKLMYFAFFSSILLIIATIYIKDRGLNFTKHILNILISLYNIISLFFMVQYFISKDVETKVYEKLLMPFFNNASFNIPLIIWIFVLTLFLQILQYQLNKPKGETYGR